MKSKTTRQFWQLFEKLPQSIQDRAILAYVRWQKNPSHRSLHFKRVDEAEPLYSARDGLNHRAVGVLRGDTMTWFWIGKHDDYDRLLS